MAFFKNNLLILFSFAVIHSCETFVRFVSPFCIFLGSFEQYFSFLRESL